MKNEHIAALLCLSDSLRSDVSHLSARLSGMSLTRVTDVLNDALDRVASPTGGIEGAEEVRTVLSEVTPAKLGKRIGLLEEYARWGVNVYTFWDEGYPSRLKTISTPPLVLMVQGRTFPGSRPVAVVGTRLPSQAGQKAAQVFAMDLARNGHTVVSGLARGIDTRAHVGALSVGGTTLAILPGHLGKVYPPENRDLFIKIRDSGALVSEVTQFVPLHRGRFIERNRITSGLSEATVIAEFHGSGGTFQQGKFALSQGRPLYVIDLGEFGGAKASAGVRQLVQMGARSVKSSEELLSSFEQEGGAGPKSRARKTMTQATLGE